MIALISSPGPVQILVVAFVIALLFGVRLPNVLQRLEPRVARRDASPLFGVSVLLQIYASLVTLWLAYVTLGPSVAALFSAIFMAIALSRL